MQTEWQQYLRVAPYERTEERHCIGAIYYFIHDGSHAEGVMPRLARQEALSSWMKYQRAPGKYTITTICVTTEIHPHRSSVRAVDQRFVLFHNKRHPNELGAAEITASLTYLAVAERVSASTQNQALALCCFCIERYCSRMFRRAAGEDVVWGPAAPNTPTGRVADSL